MFLWVKVRFLGHMHRYNVDVNKTKGEMNMKILDYIYEFLLGDDTDVPFEDCDSDFDTVTPDPEPVILRIVSTNDAA